MQQSGQTIPFIDILNSILSSDKDTQSANELASQPTARANITIELVKTLFSRLEKQDLTFETPKEIEDTLDVLAYGFVPPISQYIKDDHNYLKQIILIYDFLISDEVDLRKEGGRIKIVNTKPVLDLNDYQHQKIFIKMLSHGVLLFDRKNFERKISTPGGEARTREEEFRVPTKLCSMMIRIYHRFLYRAYPYLYIDHWEYLIKLFSGLALFITQSPSDAKFSDRINVSIVELLYNTWIFSGIQNESIWKLFKHNILEMISKDFVVSYWIDICSDLTTKLLIDYKCYEPPKLILASREEEIECHDNLLIIHHNYTFRRTSLQTVKKYTLFRQPFLFNVSKDQVLYLWGKMVNMMSTSTNNPKASLLIIEGIQNVINKLLTLGSHSKPKEEIQESTIYSGYSEYQIENKRTIKIEHDFQHFQKILSYITSQDKIRKNTKKPATGSPTPTPTPKNQPEEEKDFVPIRTKRTFFEEEESTPTLIFKKIQDEQSPTLNGTKEYSWMVKTDKLPGGDSLIKLFGKLLFESAASTAPHFEEVRLNALNTLLQIFTKAAGPFSEGATKKFYKTYLDYLESDLPWSHLQILLKHSTELFLVNHLSHNIILQKPLIMKLQEFYTKVKIESPAQEKVFRRASNKLCSSFLCFTNDEYGLINEVYRYDKNIKDIMAELLELAFQKDKDALINQRGSSTKVQLDEAKILSQSCWNLLICCILNYKIYSFVVKINDAWLDKNSPIMNDLALDMLLGIGEMCLMRLDEFEIPCPMTEDVFHSALNIVEKMRKYIEQRTKDLHEINKQPQPKAVEKEDTMRHISSAFGILYTWLHLIIHLKEVETSKEFPEVFETIVKMLISYKHDDVFGSSVKCMLGSLFNRLGNLSFSRNTPISSSILVNTDPVPGKSFDEISTKLEDKCLLTIAIGEDTLLSFYNLTLESSNEVLVFMIRNSAGKFIWFGELFYKLFSPVKDHEEEETIPSKNLLEEVKKPAKEDDHKQRGLSSEILSSPRSGGPNHELDFLLQQQFDFEDQYEETHSKLKSVQIKDKTVSEGGVSSSPEPEKEAKTVTELNAIKMFLLNTGILSLKDLDKLTHIPSETAAKDVIKKLDSCSTRCQILTSIFYVKMPSSDKLDEFPRYDKLFRKFIEELGVVIDEVTLESGAYEGIRSYVTQHKKVLFTSSPLYEMIFTLPNLTQDHKDIQESSSISPIVIVWNAKLFTKKESFYPYIINQLDLKGYRTALIITPLDESYFSLNILKKDSDFMLFPPINEFVCSNHMLVNVVMQIVISVHREYEYCHNKLLYHEITLGRLGERQQQIGELVETYRKNEYSWEVLKACLGVPATMEHP